MGKKKINSGCIYTKHILLKFQKQFFWRSFWHLLPPYLSLKAILLNPVTQQVLCIPAFLRICSWDAHKPAQWHCLANSNDQILLLLQPEVDLKHPDISLPVRWYLWFSKITFKQGKGNQHNRKAKRHKEKSGCVIWDQLGFCGMWPRSFQSVGLLTVSINVLWQLLLFMPGFKAREKEAVRDALGLQTGSVCWALKHLPKWGGHWRAVQD